MTNFKSEVDKMRKYFANEKEHFSDNLRRQVTNEII